MTNFMFQYEQTYVKEALKLAGIPEDKVISSNEYPVIGADRLVLPSFQVYLINQLLGSLNSYKTSISTKMKVKPPKT